MTTVQSSSPPDAGELLYVLTAIRAALAVPHAATVGEQETRDAILLERVGHAAAMLDGVFERLGDGRDPMIGWSAGYLRERLAEHPATGYRTWDERVAELEAAKAASKEADR
jgi:hypothetical protein